MTKATHRFRARHSWGVATNGRNWYQVFLLVLTIAFVGTALASGSEDQVIARSYPPWAQQIWYGGLILGAISALIGIAMHSITGLLVERAALFLLSGVCLSFGTAFIASILRVDLFHVLYVSFFVYSFGAVNITRALQVRRDIDEERRKLRQIGNLKEALGDTATPEVPLRDQ